MKKIFGGIFLKKQNEEASLNGLRAIAILMVMLFHYFHVLQGKFKDLDPFQSLLFVYFDNFFSGVDLFFVLSGFLISKGLWEDWNRNQKIDYKSFYLKRTFRIFPAYYFFITISLLLSKANFLIIESRIKESNDPGLLQTMSVIKIQMANSWADFVFLGNYWQGLNFHTWSLSIEEQFYLIFPLFCGLALFRRSHPQRQILLWSLYLVPTFLRMYIFSTTPQPSDFEAEIYRPFHTRFDSLIAGVIVMDLYYNGKYLIDKIEKSKTIYNTILFFTLGTLLWVLQTPKDSSMMFTYTLKYNILNLAYGILVLLSILKVKGMWTQFLSWKTFTPVAHLSYTMYLWHILFSLSGAALVIKDPMNITLSQLYLGVIASFFTVFLLSIFFYILMEYPFQKLREKLIPQKES
ncbi:acyltransferase family protein [Leptospira sp. WS92.C1]